MHSDPENNQTMAARYLEICLGSEKYAIPLLLVREVIAPPKTTPVPNSPAHFIGMMNLRGQVLGVMDLRKRLGIKPGENHLEEAVVIVEIEEISVGIYVDSVNRVLSFEKSQISEPPIGAKKSSAHISGVYKLDDDLISILALEKVLEISGTSANGRQAA